jgi:hypothetical protein
MTFALNKDITRRRRLAGDKAGDEGSFGYNMRSGKCIKKDANDTSCPDDPNAAGEGDFALLFSILALFALY